MKILVIGGTNFISPPVIHRLVAMGHEVTVFHRGQTHADLPSGVRHIYGNRQNLRDFQAEFEQISPQVVLDAIAYTEQDARTLMSTLNGIAQRVVVISSGDVYRAYDVLLGVESEPLEPVPITETSPLRQNLYPYKDFPQRPLDVPADYEKILVERVVRNDPELPGTILRLPMVYGPGDPLHRLFPYVKRMDEQRPAIVLAQRFAQWRGVWGYVENVAAAIALAITDDRATGQVYNIAEAQFPTEAERIRRIGQVAGWKGEVVIASPSLMPDSWSLPYNLEQHWVVDSTRIRQELGYVEPVLLAEALKRTIEWERIQPPETVSPAAAPELLDYDTEDAILAQLAAIRSL